MALGTMTRSQKKPATVALCTLAPGTVCHTPGDPGDAPRLMTLLSVSAGSCRVRYHAARPDDEDDEPRQKGSGRTLNIGASTQVIVRE